MFSEFLIDKTSFKVDFDPEVFVMEDFAVRSFPRDYAVRFFAENTSLTDYLTRSEPAPVIIDKHVYGIYKEAVDQFAKDVYLVTPTEENKTAQTSLEIIEFLDRCGVNKGRPAIAVGGGVIQDLAGFACGVYKRGIPWVYCPTTLLGQADSCVGGKTGLNFNGKKNVVCSFSAPSQVLICAGFIPSLSTNHIRCGLGEMFRLALTGGHVSFETYLDFLRSEKPVTTKEIKQSLLVKRAVVECDEYETNERRAMNVGHTIGHALEAATGNAIPHGIAVAYGIGIESMMARKYLNLPDSDLNKIMHCMDYLKSSRELGLIESLDTDALLAPLLADKKMVADTLYFALFRKIGDVQFHPVKLRSEIGELKQFVHEFIQRLKA